MVWRRATREGGLALIVVTAVLLLLTFRLAMVAHHRDRDWAAAQAALDRCRQQAPQLAGFYEEYENRIVYFAAEPPGADWNGVFVAETK